MYIRTHANKDSAPISKNCRSIYSCASPDDFSVLHVSEARFHMQGGTWLSRRSYNARGWNLPTATNTPLVQGFGRLHTLTFLDAAADCGTRTSEAVESTTHTAEIHEPVRIFNLLLNF